MTFIIKFKKETKLEVWGEHLGRVDWERNSAEQDGGGQASKDLEVGLQAGGLPVSSGAQSCAHTATGKTIALTRWTFVSRVMSLLCNMLSRLVITFLPGSKCLLISWLQSPSAGILEAKKNSLSLFPLFPHSFPMK